MTLDGRFQILLHDCKAWVKLPAIPCVNLTEKNADDKIYVPEISKNVPSKLVFW